MAHERLSRRGDFRLVYEGGRRARRDGISVVARPRTGGSASRVGFSVRSSSGSAVTRNRIKRRLRAAVRLCDPAAGFDIVVSADATVARAEFSTLVADLEKALQGAGVTV